MENIWFSTLRKIFSLSFFLCCNSSMSKYQLQFMFMKFSTEANITFSHCEELGKKCLALAFYVWVKLSLSLSHSLTHSFCYNNEDDSLFRTAMRCLIFPSTLHRSFAFDLTLTSFSTQIHPSSSFTKWWVKTSTNFFCT
jgi:hypothetical protein